MPPKASSSHSAPPNLRSAVDTGEASSSSTASQAAVPAAPSKKNAGSEKDAPIPDGFRKKTSIVVNARQRGNPIIPHIKNIAWEYGDIVPDYLVGTYTCVLYLSLRYHRLHPEYLFQRIEKLGAMYSLRILLVMCDVNDHQESIREISKVCIINNITVMVTWTVEEAGRYLATYKQFEEKPPDMLKGRFDDDYRSHLNRAFTSIKGVNKTDVLTLSTSFGSVDRIVRATPEELSNCPGLGDVKVRRLLEAFTGRFRPGSSSVPAVQVAKDKVAREDRALTSPTATTRDDREEPLGPSTRYSSPDWPEDDEDDETEIRTSQEQLDVHLKPTASQPLRRARNPFVVIPD